MWPSSHPYHIISTPVECAVEMHTLCTCVRGSNQVCIWQLNVTRLYPHDTVQALEQACVRLRLWLVLCWFSTSLLLPPFFSFPVWKSDSMLRSLLYECPQVRVTVLLLLFWVWHTVHRWDLWKVAVLNSAVCVYFWCLSGHLLVCVQPWK